MLAESFVTRGAGRTREAPDMSGQAVVCQNHVSSTVLKLHQMQTRQQRTFALRTSSACPFKACIPPRRIPPSRAARRETDYLVVLLVKKRQSSCVGQQEAVGMRWVTVSFYF